MQTINKKYVPEYVFALLCQCNLQMFKMYSNFYNNKRVKKPPDLIFPEKIRGDKKQVMYNVDDIVLFKNFTSKLLSEYRPIWTEYTSLIGNNTVSKRVYLQDLGYTKREIVCRRNQNVEYKRIMEGKKWKD